MLKHKIIALLAILTLAVAACGDDDDDNGNNQPNNTEPNNTEPNNTEPNNTEPNNTEPNNTEPNNTEPNNTTPDLPPNNSTETAPIDIESFQNAFVSYENKFQGFICECFYEENGFENADDCRETALQDEAEVADFAACAQGVADDFGDIPASVDNYYTCLNDVLVSAEDCHDNIDFGDEMCTEANEEAFFQCDMIAYADQENLGVECTEELDEAGFAFLTDEEGLEAQIQAECGEPAE